MTMNYAMRQGHRWLSILFMLIVAAIFAAQGFGARIAQWVYLTPLAPRALMAISGTYLFVLPYLARRR